MAKTKSERPIYAFIRKGNSLVPEMEYDLKALDGIANGQRVKVEIKAWRNLGRLRAYWMMLSEAIEATGAAPNSEVLHQYCKLKCGLGEAMTLPNGEVVVLPGSIAVANLDEPKMIEYFNSTERLLASEYGWVPEKNG